MFLGYTVKPNVYGSLAAHWLGIPVVNNIAGLGAVFISGDWLVRLVRSLYRMALGRSAKVFFQNPDDRAMFVDGGLVRGEVTELLPGSGVDLVRFAPPDVIASPSTLRQAQDRLKRGNPGSPEVMDCHGADAPRNDGAGVMDCHGAGAPRNDGCQACSLPCSIAWRSRACFWLIWPAPNGCHVNVSVE